MFRAVDHVGLTVASLERSIAFYRDVFRCTLVGTKDARGDYIATITGFADAHLRIALLDTPGSGPRLELLEYVVPTGSTTAPRTCDTASAHLCFRVEDIDAACQYLRAQGIDLRSEPVTSPSGPNRGARAVYLSDPDGFTLELLQPAMKDDPDG